MEDTKVARSQVDSEPSRFDESSEKGGTPEDMQDMIRMGKVQETRRNFHSITILGFCMVILSTWEAVLSTSVFALGNGGTAVRLLLQSEVTKRKLIRQQGLIWGYLIVMVGFGFVVASLAEMASM
jgi:choline transport protein